VDYEIKTYGNSVLREKATPVAAVDDEIRALARDMLDAMYRSNGIGLAAEQVGRRECICVIDVPPMRDEQTGEMVNQNPQVAMPMVLVNPRIEEARGEQTGPEGCLSFPDICVNVKRAAEVRVSYLDLESRSQTVETRGLLARAIQHELDHLNGVLLVDHMSAVQKVAVAGKLKRIKKVAQG
jgi:peptide deformylase